MHRRVYGLQTATTNPSDLPKTNPHVGFGYSTRRGKLVSTVFANQSPIPNDTQEQLLLKVPN